METSVEPLRYFEIKIGLKSTLDVFAGKTQPEAAAGRYRTRDDADRSVFEQLLTKLVSAIHDQEKTVDVTLQNDKWIVKDATARRRRTKEEPPDDE